MSPIANLWFLPLPPSYRLFVSTLVPPLRIRTSTSTLPRPSAPSALRSLILICLNRYGSSVCLGQVIWCHAYSTSPHLSVSLLPRLAQVLDAVFPLSPSPTSQWTFLSIYSPQDHRQHRQNDNIRPRTKVPIPALCFAISSRISATSIPLAYSHILLASHAISKTPVHASKSPASDQAVSNPVPFAPPSS